MARPEPKKRPLKYNDFDQMMADLNSLHDGGYVSHGNWTLGQACSHVADWMRFPMDGFPTPPLPIRIIFQIMKYTIASRVKARILAEGFKGGMQTAPQTVPKPNEVTDRDGIEKLQRVVDQLKAHSGELHPSPLFGQMDHAMHTKVTLLHAEHHFGYLEPKAM